MLNVQTINCMQYSEPVVIHNQTRSQSRNEMNTHTGGGELPYKGLMGTCGQPGYVFRDFCLKQGIDFIIFCVKRGFFINSFVIANGLNKKEFRYLLLSYTGYGFGLNVLNRVGKSAIFVLNRVRV